MKKTLFLLFLLFIINFIGFSQVGPVTDICLVTVDTASTHNIIVWERSSQISNIPIDSIKIYRTSVLNGDSLIATVSYDSLSEYHDYDADPNLKAWQYRIAGVDSLGVEGAMSAPHRTIHFSLWSSGDSIKLKWTPYVGKSLNFYRCWADSTGSANWNLVNSTTNSADTSWWDHSTPADWSNLDYLVDVDWTFVCTSTQKQQSHNTTRSNRATMSGQTPNRIRENTFKNLLVYPNPVENNLTINFSSVILSNLVVKVVDINGKIIINLPNIIAYGNNSYSIDVSNLHSGIYSIVVQNGENYVTQRFIKN